MKTIEKGADSESEVLESLRGFIAAATTIRSVHSDFDTRIREALFDSMYALQTQVSESNGSSDDSVLQRAVRRLVAARVDMGCSQEGELFSWERYIVPPLGNHLLTADLLL